MGNYKKHVGTLANIDVVTTREKLLDIATAFADAVAPEERLWLDEWADKYRVLPSSTSSEHGQWRTSRFPFLRKIMRAMSPQSRARHIVAMKGHQLGFTECLINKILYNAAHYPGPTLYVQGTFDSAKEFASQKLNPSIEVCPAVNHTLGADKSYAYTDEKLMRSFPGGFVSMGGASSESFLRSKSIRDGLVDEEETFKASLKGAGSPISILRKRMSNFPMSKLIRTCTPNIKETSTIEPAYLSGSQEEYYLPCPHCNPNADPHGFLFVIKWANIKWSDEMDTEGNAPKDIWLECPSCRGKIYEHKKTWMLTNGRWLHYDEETAQLLEVGDVEYPSFLISSLYSPLGFYSWRDAVMEFLDYKASGDIALHQVFVNQTLAETYTMAGQDVSSTWLMSRKEDYVNPSTGEVVDVPEGVLVLTCGADVQEDRIECEVVGWGLNGESWSIDYRVILGNTDFLGDTRGLDPNTGQPTVWTEFDRYLMGKWRCHDGVMVPIECTLIDANYRSEAVHAFCRPREGRRIYPQSGKAGYGHTGYIQRPRKRSERFQTWRFTLWVDEIKDKIYQAFLMDQPGAGYCHFPDKHIYDSKYFFGLTCENKKVKTVAGQKKFYWENPPGARNEPLDCRVYAFGTLTVYAPNLEHRAQLRSQNHDGGFMSMTQAPQKKRRGPRVVSRGL